MSADHSSDYSSVVATARDYYNSADADHFYYHVWGGEDIHIGLYADAEEPIFDASRRTVERMAARLPWLGPAHSVLDLGAGYGGAARWLVEHTGCRIKALNLSERENARHRELNRARGLDGRIEVIDGNFEAVPCADSSMDVVWSQDAILHSGKREQVVAEAARVLRPGGHFVFTDPMQSDDGPPAELAHALAPVLARIHLDSLGSVAGYCAAATGSGLAFVGFEDLTGNLVTHYGRVREELRRRRDELSGLVSKEYVERMLTGLGHWVEAGTQGHLRWGILQFAKPGD